jgi:hypothetical protein
VWRLLARSLHRTVAAISAAGSGQAKANLNEATIPRDSRKLLEPETPPNSIHSPATPKTTETAESPQSRGSLRNWTNDRKRCPIESGAPSLP